ncbi:MAG TPA: rod shape-determining protein RodA [Dongiaceae bacterium]
MSIQLHSVGSAPSLRLSQRIRQIPWSLVILITMVASIGFAMLYSAASGNVEPWMNKQMVRFAIGVCIMLAIGMVDLQRLAKIAYPLYCVAFLLLIYVEFLGADAMGAQRWINLGPIQLQPSELMKISLCLALARYFHGLTYEEIGRPWVLIPPALMALLPAGLVLKQPDLGTAGMLLLAGAGVFFVAGVRWWKFVIVFALGVAGAVGAWNSGFLHDYQKARLVTFLNPANDALGAGYHITQSKIALGSGGIWGKGLLQGTQAQLDFLPERQTDFIFTMLGEELGLVGGLLVLSLYSLLVVYGFAIALRTRSHFGRLLAFGVTMNLFLYFFINTAMVMGLIPVVGIPLPLISYGGTAMMTVMVGFGLLTAVYIQRDYRVGRRASGED